MTRAGASVLALLLALPALAANKKSHFDTRLLKVPGEVDSVAAADLDGDGKLDLLVSFKSGVTPHEKRFFAVFWNQDPGFALKPDLVVSADDDASAFDVGDVDEQPGDELLLIGKKGVWARALRGRVVGERVPLTSELTFLGQPGRGELPRVKVLQDLAGPGSHDLLVPGNGELQVYRHVGATYLPAGRLEIAAESSFLEHGFHRAPGEMAAFRLSYEHPSVSVNDLNGDGKADIFVALDDRLAVFQQGPQMTFPSRPTLERDFEILTKEELQDARHQAGIRAIDIDGDGVADVIVRKQVERGLTSALTTTFVFFGKRGGGFGEKADQVFKNEGASGTDVELVDLTADGHPDLVVPSINIGVLALIRALTTQTLNVTSQVFPFDPVHRRFAEKPSAERDLKFNLSLSGEADLAVIDERGDVNGDRRPDLVFGTGEHELSIFPGVAGPEIFAADAVETLPVRAFGLIQPVDLCRQGKVDLVLHYPHTKGHRDEIAVLLNRGPW